jgi:hypothetical protein
MKKITIMLIIILTSFYSVASSNKGLDIAKELKNRDIGWNNSISSVKMILRNPSGDESVRDINIKALEVLDGGDKSLTIFNKPIDVSGTAFLNHSMILEPDLQWMFLPAIKRTKRITSRNKSGPFMGSEFAYEDMSSFEIEKFNFKYIKSQKLKSVNTFVIEQVPVDKFSGYSKQIVWKKLSKIIKPHSP